MGATKPAPVVTPETRPFWDGCARGELWIQRCGRCQAHYFYPRPACPHCGLPDAVEWVRCSGRASLHSYVISHIAAPGYEDETPYVIAVVQLEEGPRLTTNLVGATPAPEALDLDMALVVDFEARQGATVPVFRPAR